MAIVYEKSRGLTDVEFHYCPGCHHGIIHKLVAESLVELGLLDDQAYAESNAKELFLRKRYGARRVRQELSRKGIGRDIIDQVLEQYQDMDQAAGENIALVLERRYPTWREDEKARRRAVAALQRLGYSFEQVRAVMGGLDTE